MDNRLSDRVEALLKALPSETRPQAEQDIRAITDAGIDTFEKLIEVINDTQIDTYIRLAACWLLSRIGNEMSIPALIKAFQDDNPLLRRAAVQAVGDLNAEKQEVIPHLANVLFNDKEVEVNKAAAYALGWIGGERAVGLLLEVLCDKGCASAVRGMSAESLSNAGGKTAIPKLVQALSDSSIEVRFWCVFALGQIADVQVLPELERLVSTDNASLDGWGTVSQEAADAILQIKKRAR